MSISAEDLQHIREAAEGVHKAFSGPWVADRDRVYRDPAVHGAHELVCDIRSWGRLTGSNDVNLRSEQAARIQDGVASFIAAASPEAVIALCDEVERMRRALHDIAQRLANCPG